MPARSPALRAPAAATDSLCGARVLVVGVNYAPDTTGIAPYTTAAAEHLASLGAQVTVVTGVPHYPQWRVPVSYRRTLVTDERLGGVTVRRARHYVPRQQDAVRRGLFEVSWLPAAAVQDARSAADVVLAVSPSLAAMPLARWAAARRRVPWAVVVQDLMGNAAANGGVRGGGRVSSVVGAIEARNLRSADRVGVIGEGFAAAVQAMGVAADRIRILPNWTHVTASASTVDEARRALGWPAGFTAVHTGNMGTKQGLENVVEAARLADARGADVTFVLVGDGSQRAALQDASRGIQRLRFVPPVAAEQYPLVLAAADALVVNERPDMLEMSLPSKLTSYLSAGRPVLAAVPASGWTATVLDESGCAVRVRPDDPAALLDAAAAMSRDPRKRDGLAVCGLSYAERRYGARAGKDRYADLVRELLALT